jgi:hypothetical protein
MGGASCPEEQLDVLQLHRENLVLKSQVLNQVAALVERVKLIRVQAKEIDTLKNDVLYWKEPVENAKD